MCALPLSGWDIGFIFSALCGFRRTLILFTKSGRMKVSCSAINHLTQQDFYFLKMRPGFVASLPSFSLWSSWDSSPVPALTRSLLSCFLFHFPSSSSSNFCPLSLPPGALQKKSSRQFELDLVICILLFPVSLSALRECFPGCLPSWETWIVSFIFLSEQKGGSLTYQSIVL